MKSLLKKYIPSKFIQIWRSSEFKRKAMNRKIFSDGTTYYGLQSENYERGIMVLLDKLSLDYKKFVNFGANTGYYPVRLASKFDAILAVEALTENYKILLLNIHQNNLSSKVTCLHLAVGDAFRLVKFYCGSTGGSLIEGWNGQVNLNETVQLVRGDNLVSSFVSDESGALFLIDCEAAEYEVLRGLENTIANTNSSFLVEIPCREFMPNDEFNPNFLNIFKLMDSYQYTPTLVNNDGSLSKLSNEMVNGFVRDNRYEGMMVLYRRTTEAG